MLSHKLVYLASVGTPRLEAHRYFKILKAVLSFKGDGVISRKNQVWCLMGPVLPEIKKNLRRTLDFLIKYRDEARSRKDHIKRVRREYRYGYERELPPWSQFLEDGSPGLKCIPPGEHKAIPFKKPTHSAWDVWVQMIPPAGEILLYDWWNSIRVAGNVGFPNSTDYRNSAESIRSMVSPRVGSSMDRTVPSRRLTGRTLQALR